MQFGLAVGRFQDNPNSSANRLAVALGSHQFEVEKPISVAGIQKHRVLELVARIESTKLVVDVLVTIIVDVGKCHAVAFL